MWNSSKRTVDDAKLAALRGVPGLRGLRDQELAALTRLVDEAWVPAGRVLVEQGTLGHQAFLVVAGTADVFSDGELIAQVGPGDILGELALVDHGPRSATVVAATRMQLLVIGKGAFTTFTEVPTMARTLARTLAARQREAEARRVAERV